MMSEKIAAAAQGGNPAQMTDDEGMEGMEGEEGEMPMATRGIPSPISTQGNIKQQASRRGAAKTIVAKEE